MDPAVTRRLHDAFRKTLEDPAVLATFEKYDQSVIYMNSDDYDEVHPRAVRQGEGDDREARAGDEDLKARDRTAGRKGRRGFAKDAKRNPGKLVWFSFATFA